MRSASKTVVVTSDKSVQRIEYLSPPAPVSMADRWFEISSIDHFWVRRRFAALQKLAGHRILRAREVAEFGCGHGLLQRQIEDAYGKSVWGFDLNESALKQNVSRRSRVCCYDVLQCVSALQGKFDVILLFDVLEHISDEFTFLRALSFHLAPGGVLILNVPAGQWAWSSYDVADGHLRRYSFRTLQKAVCTSGFALLEWSYWGLPLVPAVLLRKLLLFGEQDQNKAVTVGFDSRSATINKIMGRLSRCEWLPQRLLGTSMMAILEYADQRALRSPSEEISGV